jgi:LacI family transcriptional regulator
MKQKRRGVTIKDVAKKAEVSTATVSRVLNNDTRVTKKTRNLVYACLEETGYQMNPIARSLRVQRTHTIGILAPEFQNDFFAAVAEGIEEVLRLRGYTTFLVNSRENPEEERRRVQLLIEKQVDGAIIIPASHMGQHFEALRSRDIPFVLVDRMIDDMQEDCVLTDNRKGAFAAVEACIQAGAEQVAVIAGDQHLTSAKERFEGYQAAMLTNGKPLLPCLTHQGNMHVQSGYDAMKSILNSRPETAYVFIVNLFMRIGAEKYLVEQKIGNTVKIAAFDVSAISSLFTHSFVTVKQPLEQIGTTAANLLLQRIEHKDIPFPRIFRLQPQLIFD